MQCSALRRSCLRGDIARDATRCHTASTIVTASRSKRTLFCRSICPKHADKLPVSEGVILGDPVEDISVEDVSSISMAGDPVEDVSVEDVSSISMGDMAGAATRACRRGRGS